MSSVDGKSLTSISHPPGLMDKIADAIRDGRLQTVTEKRRSPPVTKKGPKPSGNALTPAEKQKAYRERLKSKK